MTILHLYQRNQSIAIHHSLSPPKEELPALRPEQSLHSHARHLHTFFHMACRGSAILSAHVYNYVSTTAIVVFSYRYHDSYSDDDDNHTIATIAQL